MINDNHDIPVRLRDLRAKLDARDGSSGYKENCDAIKKEIAKLEAILNNYGPVA